MDYKCIIVKRKRWKDTWNNTTDSYHTILRINKKKTNSNLWKDIFNEWLLQKTYFSVFNLAFSFFILITVILLIILNSVTQILGCHCVTRVNRKRNILQNQLNRKVKNTMEKVLIQLQNIFSLNFASKS